MAPALLPFINHFSHGVCVCTCVCYTPHPKPTTAYIIALKKDITFQLKAQVSESPW